MAQTVSDIKERLKLVDEQEFVVLERSLKGDTRKGVQVALAQARKRLESDRQERERVQGLYDFERELAQEGLVVGLDEVGRGPLAGPLTIGAVVLNPEAALVEGLNDSKQIPEAKRDEVAHAVKAAARAWAIVHVSPAQIDEEGMSSCLRQAFSSAVAKIEDQLGRVDVILLDGNPLHLDEREINVVKGDSKCASIAGASVIAKVERDRLMREYDVQYPGYDLASSKGYGSERHRQAISEKGLTPIHRASFCGNFLQESLF
ncbi:MAG: ribonuclease HII [Coriobacteriia bacterium]|nr:ribonuclease HII [Coriobacteriia bacterium]